MVANFRPIGLAGLFLTIALSGCFGADDADNATAQTDAPDFTKQPVEIQQLLNQSEAGGADVPPMVFEESLVDAAYDPGTSLYEPTMEVSDSGQIYITGHSIAVDSTGAPVYHSSDDGASWVQLPFTGEQRMQGDEHGATPPPSDEIFLVAGDDGWLFGVDITLATYPVNAWADDGARHAYHNPNAYDESQNSIQATEDCQPVPAKDRPWAAYSNGKLLMISNPGGGKAQLGVMDVPRALEYEPNGPAAGAVWNLCAGPGGSIPGLGDLRPDGKFAVVQRSTSYDGTPSLYAILGNVADIMDTRIVKVYEVTTNSKITSTYGHAAFDKHGDLFVGMTNNTVTDCETSDSEFFGSQTTCRPDKGRLLLATSTDAGETYINQTFEFDKPIRHIYMDGNKAGAGALVVWATNGDNATEAGFEPDDDNFTQRYDWFVGHMYVGEDGQPMLENVYLAIDEGPMPSAHVTGAAVGPDGRAYLAQYTTGSGTPENPTQPLSVYIQRGGPTMDVA